MSSTKASLTVVPKFLPFGPPPMLGELASSWLERVATANAITLEELLECAGFGEWPAASPGFMPDLGMPAAGRGRLAALCRLPEGSIEALDLQRQFPAAGVNWFIESREPLGLPEIEPGFCPDCIREQVHRGEPAHLRAEWALAFLTHCPVHLLPLDTSCGNCYSSSRPALPSSPPGIVQCRRCGAPLRPPPTKSRRRPGLPIVASLQAAIIGSLRGHAPDPFWAGRVSASVFLGMVEDLIQLLTHRQSGEGSMLAKRLGPEEFECRCFLPRALEQPRFAALHSWARLMVMASLTQFLLGPRSVEFFESVASFPSQDLPTYPLGPGTLSSDEWEFVLNRLPHWPETLRDRVERVALASGIVKTAVAAAAAA